ncbi:uncharacterized protein [Temnothorax longispinosus]|uniref:uncharacterized protein isoform X2 n=1 Tax=Temnothorax longispinosus TaxID=300112 RepID=UPI003A99821B
MQKIQGRNRQLQRLSIKCRTDIFINRGIYVPENIRSCPEHLDDEGCFPKDLHAHFEYFDRSYMLANEEFRIISPVSNQQFDEIVTYCDPIPQLNGRRYIKEKDVLLFLCKLRQGLPDDFLKLLIKYNSRQAVSLAVANVRQSLMLRFVPENIGLGTITREEYIQRHVTDFANTLYNPDVENRQVIVYIDESSFSETSTNGCP